MTQQIGLSFRCGGFAVLVVIIGAIIGTPLSQAWADEATTLAEAAQKLQSRDLRERLEAIDELEALGAGGVHALASALAAGPATAIPAAEALGRLEKAAVSAAASLRAMLRSDHPAARVAAVRALGDIRTDDAATFAALWSLAIHDKPRVRPVALAVLADVFALRLIGEVEALASMAEFDDDIRVRRAAVEAMVAAESLSGREGGGVAAGITTTASETTASETTATVVSTLASVLAGDPDPELRARAAELLRWRGGGAATSALARAVADRSPQVQLQAAEALRRRGAVIPLRAVFPDAVAGPDAGAPSVGPGSADDTGGAAPRDLRPQVRLAILVVLDPTDEEAAVWLQDRYLNDSDAKVRAAALGRLPRLPAIGTVVVTRLREELREASPDRVSGAVLAALGRARPGSLVAEAELLAAVLAVPSGRAGEAAAAALARAGAPGERALREALASPESIANAAVVRWLGAAEEPFVSADPAAFMAVVDRRGRPDQDVFACWNGLGAIGDEAFARELLAGDRQPGAEYALEGHLAVGLRAIKALVRSTDANARRVAAEGLARWHRSIGAGQELARSTLDLFRDERDPAVLEALLAVGVPGPMENVLAAMRSAPTRLRDLIREGLRRRVARDPRVLKSLLEAATAHEIDTDAVVDLLQDLSEVNIDLATFLPGLEGPAREGALATIACAQALPSPEMQGKIAPIFAEGGRSRMLAACAIARPERMDAAEWVAEALRSDDALIERAALRASWRFGSRLPDPMRSRCLALLFEATESNIREAADRVVASAPPSAPGLARVISATSHSDPRVRARACWLLGTLGDRVRGDDGVVDDAVIDALAVAGYDPEPEVVEEAIRTLVGLEVADRGLRELAFDQLEIGNAAAIPLAALLLRRTGGSLDEELLQAVIEVGGRAALLGDEAVDALYQARATDAIAAILAKRPDAPMRRLCWRARALGIAGADPVAREGAWRALVPAAREARPFDAFQKIGGSLCEARSAAILAAEALRTGTRAERRDALAYFGCAGAAAGPAVPTLLSMAFPDERRADGPADGPADERAEVAAETDVEPEMSADPGLQIDALVALSAVGRHAVPGLRAELARPDPAGRAQAAEALGWMGSEAHEAVPDLIRALSDLEPEVRFAATSALAESIAFARSFDERALREVAERTLRAADHEAADHPIADAMLDVLLAAPSAVVVSVDTIRLHTDPERCSAFERGLALLGRYGEAGGAGVGLERSEPRSRGARGRLQRGGEADRAVVARVAGPNCGDLVPRNGRLGRIRV